MRFRLVVIALMGLLAAGGSPLLAETPGTETAEEAYRKKLHEQDEKSLADRNAGYKALEEKVKAMQDARKKLSEPQSGEVKIDEETIPVKEPGSAEEAIGLTGGKRVRDYYEFSPDDYDVVVRDRWAINLSDFKFDTPRYITRETSPGSEKVYFAFTFSITNSSTKARRIAPIFTAVTNRGSFLVQTGGYFPERMLADSMNRPLGGSTLLADKELASQNIAPLESVVDMITSGTDKAAGGLKPASTFEPGQTRWGAAVWSDFDNNFTELKIVIQGLTNSNRYEEKMQRVLVLNFERNSDGFNVSRSELVYKGKKWDYLWMWDQDITVPIPADAKDPQIKVQKLKTPAGFDRFCWAFPWDIKNSTRTNQEISINSISFVCPIEVEVGGVKVPVELRVVDDGTNTIYKSAVQKELGGEQTKDRFQNKTLVDGAKTQVERRKILIEPGKSIEKNWAVFDQNDVDWKDAIEQVEGFLSHSANKEELSQKFWDNAVKNAAKNDVKLTAKNPGYLYEPRRTLNDDELKSVKEQILKAIPDAVEKAKTKKTVVAVFNGVSGMSTGEFRISRSYRQPGVVDESWLKGFEESEK